MVAVGGEVAGLIALYAALFLLPILIYLVSSVMAFAAAKNAVTLLFMLSIIAIIGGAILSFNGSRYAVQSVWQREMGLIISISGYFTSSICFLLYVRANNRNLKQLKKQNS